MALDRIRMLTGDSGSSGGGGGGDSSAEIAALEAEIATLEAQAATLGAQNVTLTSANATLTASNASLTTANSTLTSTVAARDATIVTRNATIAARDATIVTRDATIASLTSDLAAANGGPDHLSFLASSAVVPWTNQPSAETEFLGNQNRRIPYNGVGKTEFRLTVGGAASGAAGSVLRGKYSTNGGTTFVSLGGGDVSIAALGTAVPPVSAGWISLPVGARVDGIMSIFGQGGDAVADPSFTLVDLELR